MDGITAGIDTGSGYFVGAVIVGAVLLFLLGVCVVAALVGGSRVTRREERDADERRIREGSS